MKEEVIGDCAIRGFIICRRFSWDGHVKEDEIFGALTHT
jgi:hypothetical protein